MENFLEKSFLNKQLGIKLNSYIDEKCRVWFQAKQVALILGYKKTEDAIKRHVSESNKRKIVHPVKHGVVLLPFTLMKQVSTNLFLDLDYLLQKCFDSGCFPKYSRLFVNTDISKCLNPN